MLLALRWDAPAGSISSNNKLRRAHRQRNDAQESHCAADWQGAQVSVMPVYFTSRVLAPGMLAVCCACAVPQRQLPSAFIMM